MGGEGVEAEDLEADCYEPVGKRSLLHVADSVDVEGDPVSGEDHVASCAGVCGVRIVEEGRTEESGEEEDYPETDEDEECVRVVTVGRMVPAVRLNRM